MISLEIRSRLRASLVSRAGRTLITLTGQPGPGRRKLKMASEDKPNLIDWLNAFQVGTLSMGAQIHPISELQATCDCEGKARVRSNILICLECKAPYEHKTKAPR